MNCDCICVEFIVPWASFYLVFPAYVLKDSSSHWQLLVSMSRAKQCVEKSVGCKTSIWPSRPVPAKHQKQGGLLTWLHPRLECFLTLLLSNSRIDSNIHIQTRDVKLQTNTFISALLDYIMLQLYSFWCQWKFTCWNFGWLDFSCHRQWWPFHIHISRGVWVLMIKKHFFHPF